MSVIYGPQGGGGFNPFGLLGTLAMLIPGGQAIAPWIAGAGALTTLLSLRSQYESTSILTAVLANMVVVYAVLRMAKKLDKWMSPGLIFTLQKFFGIILLAISVKLFMANITLLIAKLS